MLQLLGTADFQATDPPLNENILTVCANGIVTYTRMGQSRDQSTTQCHGLEDITADEIIQVASTEITTRYHHDGSYDKPLKRRPDQWDNTTIQVVGIIKNITLQVQGLLNFINSDCT